MDTHWCLSTDQTAHHITVIQYKEAVQHMQMIQRPFSTYAYVNDSSFSSSCSSVSWNTWQTATLLVLDELSHCVVLQVSEVTQPLLTTAPESQTHVFNDSV